MCWAVVLNSRIILCSYVRDTVPLKACIHFLTTWVLTFGIPRWEVWIYSNSKISLCCPFKVRITERNIKQYRKYGPKRAYLTRKQRPTISLRSSPFRKPLQHMSNLFQIKRVGQNPNISLSDPYLYSMETMTPLSVSLNSASFSLSLAAIRAMSWLERMGE